MSIKIKAYSFPSSNFKLNGSEAIEDFLFKISPKVTITPIQTNAMSYKVIENILTSMKLSLLNGNTNNTETNADNFFDKMSPTFTNTNGLPKSIQLFFKTMITSARTPYIFVITSSPNIQVDLSKGWKNSQSIFSFLKEMFGNEAYSNFFGKKGENFSSIFSSGTQFVQSFTNDGS